MSFYAPILRPKEVATDGIAVLAMTRLGRKACAIKEKVV